MATINKRFFKNTTLHSNFAKRSKDSEINEVVDVTDVQEYLKKDWEKLVEVNPEYLQPEILFDKLIRERLPLYKWRAKIEETKTEKTEHFLFEIMFAQRRRAARIARERYKERRMLKYEINHLENIKEMLLKEKKSLQETIDFYKTKTDEIAVFNSLYLRK